MSPGGSAGPAAALRRRLAAFLRWWVAGLKALLPGPLRRLLGDGGYRLLLSLDDDALVLTRVGAAGRESVGRYALTPDGGRLRGPPPGVLAKARELVLCLPEDQALVQRLRLPLAVEPNLHRVLGYTMDAQTPFSAEQVYYDGCVLARDRSARMLDIELSVAPRATVDTALAALGAVGLHPDRVAVERTGADACPEQVNLLATGGGRRGSRLQRVLNAALIALALALAAVLAALPLWEKHQSLRALESALEVAGREAQAARTLRAEIHRLSADASFLAEKRRAAPLVLTILDELTRLLPDDTWVNTLRLRDGGVELNGHAQASAALIPLLDASPLFGNVRFLSPVTRDRLADDERFHLAMDLAAEAGRP
jgi:general secretion pathway protein L